MQQDILKQYKPRPIPFILQPAPEFAVRHNVAGIQVDLRLMDHGFIRNEDSNDESTGR